MSIGSQAWWGLVDEAWLIMEPWLIEASWWGLVDKTWLTRPLVDEDVSVWSQSWWGLPSWGGMVYGKWKYKGIEPGSELLMKAGWWRYESKKASLINFMSLLSQIPYSILYPGTLVQIVGIPSDAIFSKWRVIISISSSITISSMDLFLRQIFLWYRVNSTPYYTMPPWSLVYVLYAPQLSKLKNIKSSIIASPSTPNVSLFFEFWILNFENSFVINLTVLVYLGN